MSDTLPPIDPYTRVPGKAQFAVPNKTVNSGTSGTIPRTRIDNRQIQFGLKYIS